MRTLISLLFLAALAVTTVAQDKPGDEASADRARVFITDSKSWEMAGAGGGSSSGFGGATRGGARPQTAEIIKTSANDAPE